MTTPGTSSSPPQGTADSAQRNSRPIWPLPPPLAAPSYHEPATPGAGPSKPGTQARSAAPPAAAAQPTSPSHSGSMSRPAPAATSPTSPRSPGTSPSTTAPSEAAHG